ncbi:MAG: response regulator [Candidatus Lokiarchaeota archaeon]|nr:response regulator [Candidatus Lokiarchaeota archaeon]
MDTKVIVAGDISFLCVLLKMEIENAGMEVLAEVSNKADLLDQCIRKEPDIVIVDFQIPEIESLRLIQDLLDIDPLMSIVTISDAIGGYSEKVLAAGARAFLQKPFSTYDLIDTVKKVTPVLRY